MYSSTSEGNIVVWKVGEKTLVTIFLATKKKAQTMLRLELLL